MSGKHGRNSIAVWMVFGLLFGGASASAAPDPFTLTFTATGNGTQTNVTLTVTPSAGFTAPTLADHIQVKAINPATGQTVITKSYVDVPMTGGQATVVFPAVATNTPLNVQVNFKTVDHSKSRVLRAGTVVMSPLDIAIIGLVAPGSAPGNTPFNVAVSVKELNGSLGATFDVEILQDETTLVGSTPGASVTAGGTVSVNVSVTVPHAGPTTDENFTAVLTNINPPDAVSANNAALFTVEIQGATVPTFDAAITSVSAPSSVVEHDLFNVDVTVQEVTSLQGGTFDIQIIRDESAVVVGSQSGVSIAAGGTVNLSIECSVSLLGDSRTLAFTAQLINISPADSTVSNDSAAFSINVFCSFDDFDCGS